MDPLPTPEQCAAGATPPTAGPAPGGTETIGQAGAAEQTLLGLCKFFGGAMVVGALWLGVQAL